MSRNRVAVRHSGVAVDHVGVGVKQNQLAAIYSRIAAVLSGVAVPHAKDAVLYSEMEEPPQEARICARRNSVGQSYHGDIDC